MKIGIGAGGMTNREIDALVAKHVIGWDMVAGCFARGGHLCPEYSTDIKAAWEVVKKLRLEDIYMKMEEFSPGWRVEFAYSDENILGMANRTTAPMAICKAALKCKGIEVE